MNEGPITAACHTPEVAYLVEQIAARLPPGTTLFVIAVGPRDDHDRREIAVGGDPSKRDEIAAAAEALRARVGAPGLLS